MSNIADSLSHEAQLKRLWKWVGELRIEISDLKKEIDSLKEGQGVNGTIDAVSLNPTAKDIGLDFNDDG
jgi:hypothetical protein